MAEVAQRSRVRVYCGGEVERAAIEGLREVVVIVEHALRGIGMRVDNDGGVVYGFSGLWIHSRGLCGKRKCSDKQESGDRGLHGCNR